MLGRGLLPRRFLSFIILPSSPFCFQILQSSPLCFKRLLSIPLCFKRLQSNPLCFKMLLSNPAWFSLLTSSVLWFVLNMLQSNPAADGSNLKVRMMLYFQLVFKIRSDYSKYVGKLTRFRSNLHCWSQLQHYDIYEFA